MDTFEGAKTPHGKIIVGVYKLVHRDSGKFYIGSSGDFYNRRKTHIVALRAGQHHLQEMQNLYNESPHFTFELVSIGINYKDPAVREKAYDREQELLDQYWGDPLLLNQSRSARNIKLSEEREAARINKVHQAHQKPEVRAKVTAVNRTIRQSDKARKQQSVISKSLWQNDGHRARPSPEHTIERDNNNKGYSKENCRWATRKEQANNRRTNIYYALNGENKTLQQWCDELDLKYITVYNRLKRGIKFEEAIQFIDYSAITFDETTLSLAEWCDLLNLKYNDVYLRLLRGESFSDIAHE